MNRQVEAESLPFSHFCCRRWRGSSVYPQSRGVAGMELKVCRLYLGPIAGVGHSEIRLPWTATVFWYTPSCSIWMMHLHEHRVDPSDGISPAFDISFRRWMRSYSDITFESMYRHWHSYHAFCWINIFYWKWLGAFQHFNSTIFLATFRNENMAPYWNVTHIQSTQWHPRGPKLINPRTSSNETHWSRLKKKKMSITPSSQKLNSAFLVKCCLLKHALSG